jgi:hypothetical protein
MGEARPVCDLSNDCPYPGRLAHYFWIDQWVLTRAHLSFIVAPPIQSLGTKCAQMTRCARGKLL